MNQEQEIWTIDHYIRDMCDHILNFAFNNGYIPQLSFPKGPVNSNTQPEVTDKSITITCPLDKDPNTFQNMLLKQLNSGSKLAIGDSDTCTVKLTKKSLSKYKADEAERQLNRQNLKKNNGIFYKVIQFGDNYYVMECNVKDPKLKQALQSQQRHQQGNKNDREDNTSIDKKKNRIIAQIQEFLITGTLEEAPTIYKDEEDNELLTLYYAHQILKQIIQTPNKDLIMETYKKTIADNQDTQPQDSIKIISKCLLIAAYYKMPGAVYNTTIPDNLNPLVGKLNNNLNGYPSAPTTINLESDTTEMDMDNYLKKLEETKTFAISFPPATAPTAQQIEGINLVDNNNNNNYNYFYNNNQNQNQLYNNINNNNQNLNNQNNYNNIDTAQFQQIAIMDWTPLQLSKYDNNKYSGIFLDSENKPKAVPFDKLCYQIKELTKGLYEVTLIPAQNNKLLPYKKTFCNVTGYNSTEDPTKNYFKFTINGKENNIAADPNENSIKALTENDLNTIIPLYNNQALDNNTFNNQMNMQANQNQQQGLPYIGWDNIQLFPAGSGYYSCSINYNDGQSKQFTFNQLYYKIEKQSDNNNYNVTFMPYDNGKQLGSFAYPNIQGCPDKNDPSQIQIQIKANGKTLLLNTSPEGTSLSSLDLSNLDYLISNTQDIPNNQKNNQQMNMGNNNTINKDYIATGANFTFNNQQKNNFFTDNIGDENFFGNTTSNNNQNQSLFPMPENQTLSDYIDRITALEQLPNEQHVFATAQNNHHFKYVKIYLDSQQKNNLKQFATQGNKHILITTKKGYTLTLTGNEINYILSECKKDNQENHMLTLEQLIIESKRHHNIIIKPTTNEIDLGVKEINYTVSNSLNPNKDKAHNY